MPDGLTQNLFHFLTTLSGDLLENTLCLFIYPYCTTSITPAHSVQISDSFVHISDA